MKNKKLCLAKKQGITPCFLMSTHQGKHMGYKLNVPRYELRSWYDYDPKEVKNG